MTTGKPPKMKTAKRGPLPNDDGKRGGLETRSIRTKKSIKHIKRTGPQAILTLQKKPYFHNKESPRMGGYLQSPTTPQHKKQLLKIMKSKRGQK